MPPTTGAGMSRRPSAGTHRQSTAPICSASSPTIRVRSSEMVQGAEGSASTSRISRRDVPTVEGPVNGMSRPNTTTLGPHDT